MTLPWSLFAEKKNSHSRDARLMYKDNHMCEAHHKIETGAETFEKLFP